MPARSVWSVTAQTDADRQVYFRPELWKLGVAGPAFACRLMFHSAAVSSTAPGNTAVQGRWGRDKARLCQALVTRFHEEKGKRKTKATSRNMLELFDLSAESGSYCRGDLAQVISLWWFYNENNVVIRSACNWVDAGLEEEAGNGVCKTAQQQVPETRCALYQLPLLGGGQQGNVFSKSEAAQETSEQSTVCVSGKPALLFSGVQQQAVQGKGKRISPVSQMHNWEQN